MTEVENTLRTQRDIWQQIAERTAGISSREFPPGQPKRILLFGLGSSHFAAKLTGYSLIRDRFRPRIPVVACSSMDIGHEVVPTKGDWAFALTHRGTTPVTRKALEMCANAGAFPIQVSGLGAQEISVARLMLSTSPQEKVEPHTMAVTGAICAITTLLLGNKVLEEWDALRSIGDPNLDLYRERAGTGPAVILGEWEGEWLAREGALKMVEMAGLPVRAYGSEEFFHGQQFSVKPGDRIWQIAMPDDVRTSEIRAAHRIDVYGASPLAWVPALIELQWLGLAVALNLGVNPDQPKRS